MSLDLFALMPAIHRRRDDEGSRALRAVFDALQSQHDLLHDDIGRLYDDWFAETCEPWLLPYIGELVAAGRLGRRLHPGLNTRALVTDALADRRRKGVRATLERLVSRATGWSAQVIEPAERLARAPSVAAFGSAAGGAPTLRDGVARARAGGPLERARRMPHVRAGAQDAGSVEIRLWPYQSAPLRGVDAALADGDGSRRRLHPLNLDAPLFQPPDDADVGAVTFPGPVTRRGLQLLGDGGTPPFRLRLDGEDVPASDIRADDLGDWRPARPDARILLDPERGRVLLTRADDHARTLSGDYGYGFVDDLGGGAYPRAPSPSRDDRRRYGGWAEEPGRPPTRGSRGHVIRLPTSATRRPDGDTAWELPLAGGNLAIVAADGERPCLAADLEVTAGRDGGVLILDGLLIGGTLRVHGPATVILRHCTVWPPARQAAVVVTEGGAGAELHVESSMLGPVVMAAEDVRLHARSSIIEGVRGRAGALPGLTAAACTFAGAVAAEALDAVDSLFLDTLDIADVAAGGVDHCWLPDGSRTPRRRACLGPEPAEGQRPCPPPRFTSRRRGQPGYMHMRPDPIGLFETAASDGQSLGAYHGVGDRLRRDNLDDVLTEHLPFHVRATITHAC